METIQIIEEEPAITGWFPISRADVELITEGLLLLENEAGRGIGGVGETLGHDLPQHATTYGWAQSSASVLFGRILNWDVRNAQL